MRVLAEFSVAGVMGLPRARVTVLPNGMARHYPAPKGEAHKLAVRTAYRRATVHRAPSERPIGVRVSTTRPLPKSAPKRRDGEADTHKPDADNVLKLVLDALNGLAWVDDCQVIDAHIVKMPRVRGADERTHVIVFEFEEG